ncbi:MAG: hypothetical protein M3R47_05765, partial [Chloroflexota bacterium]|nr:hypothetical protein [Chloroflexota bacterium]
MIIQIKPFVVRRVSMYKNRFTLGLGLLVIASMILAACAPAAPPSTAAPAEPAEPVIVTQEVFVT